MALPALMALMIGQQSAPVPDFPKLESAPKVTGDFLVDPVSAQARVYRGPNANEITLDNGLVRRTFTLGPAPATIQITNLHTGENFIRSVKPEALLTLNGHEYKVGGLLGQPNQAYLKPEWLDKMTADPDAFRLTKVTAGPCSEPFPVKTVRRSESHPWPPKGIQLTLTSAHPKLPGLTVEVHHELYDGIPVLMKRLTIKNTSNQDLKLDRYTCEILGVVENSSDMESVADQEQGDLQALSDYCFGGMDFRTADKGTHWVPDPDYETQVSYQKLTPCLLRSEPPVGPGVTLKPGETFESHRSFLILHDDTDRERRGLAVRRFYRTLAPWCTESPLMLHLTTTDPAKVKTAIDQAAECGFEMVIFSFGSGLNMEDESAANLQKFEDYRKYASSKGLELGGYSLLASRSINAENDAVNPKTGKPGGAIFGNSPCLCSQWGIDYFAHLHTFFAQTGFDLLEHDGSYPGDLCASTTHPGHVGLEDSQWQQWKSITDFYKFCRLHGTYLNVPDWYILTGSNKTAMGYRETNWSLPRDQQHIHARQNMYDGTWLKPPTSGWMFVPLTEYHGGGPAATMEPLEQNLSDYERHLQNCLGYGVQACYRGPRLYDTEKTKAVVIKWVSWFKKHRDILESDVVHLRRPDGQRPDFALHVNPNLKERAMLVIYNPLGQTVKETIKLPLYYSGLKGKCHVSANGGPSTTLPLDQNQTATLTYQIPARGFSYYIFAP